MAIEVFSEAWAKAWCRVLNTRPAYQAAAASWEGAVALVMARDGSASSEARSVFLDLWHGECREARVASQGDLENARYVLSGTAPAWRGVLTGTLAPLTALMTGKIRLTRGSMASLVPLAGAARELVNAAAEMEVSFPAGW
jgi:putative sterol carrier protein